MSDVSWTITPPGGGVAVAMHALGVEVARVNFRLDDSSRMILRAARDIDAEGAWYGADEIVTVMRDGLPYFSGRAIPGYDASPDGEWATVELIGPYEDLTQITYQESWAVGAGSVMMPFAVLGLNSSGAHISTGDQISQAVGHAVSRGAYLQNGGAPEGVYLWPTEARNMSCEAVMRESMRFHPDWVAVEMHNTAPPTLMVQSRNALPVVTLDVPDPKLVSISPNARIDMSPLGVRVIYQTATIIDGEVYRDYAEDTAGATDGRRVITAVIDLAGAQMQTQKQRIQTRTLPDAGNTGQAKDWLKKKFPQLAEVSDGAWEVSFVGKSLMMDEDEEPPPVNPAATRLNVSSVNDLPRELVRGSIEDWMRRTVGRVCVKVEIKVNGGTSDERKTLDLFRGYREYVVTATNAVTKLYKGISQWTPPADRPAIGLAAAVMAGTGSVYEGAVALTNDELPAGQWTGRRISVTCNGQIILPPTLVHSHDCDLTTGEEVISFGPSPYASPEDLYEIQRAIRQRPVTWWSAAERASNQLGSETKPSARGDTVTGFDIPETISPGGGGGADGPLGELVPTTVLPPDVGGGGLPPSSGLTRVYVTTGFWNGILPTNVGASFDVPSSVDTWFFAVASLNQTGDRFTMTSWSIVTGGSASAHQTSAWPTNGDLPATFVVPLGKYSGATGRCSASKSGSIWSEVVTSNIRQQDGAVSFTRSILARR